MSVVAVALALPVAAALDSPVPLAVGVILLIAGAFLLLRYRRSTRTVDRSRSTWLQAQAKIVDFQLEAPDGKPAYRPVYEFAAPGLRNVHATAPNDPPLASKSGLGHARTVFYNPDDARDFTAISDADHWITLWAGLALASIGAASIVAWLVGPSGG